MALAAAAAGAGCGGKDAAQEDAAVIHGSALTIYSSVPEHGASGFNAQSVVDGERLALAQAANHVGRYRIVLRSLDDSTLQRGTWDPGKTTENARVAVRDPS